jgi:hypothetical protein
MTDQGRFLKVMFALMGSMTLGALILLGLEGKPIQPMAFSLSSTTQLAPAQSALGTESGISQGQWRRIEIEYSNGQSEMNCASGPTGRLAREYHFIISNGQSGGDGEIFATHRWTKQRACLNKEMKPGENSAIRICLLDNNQQRHSTPRQASQLESLVQSLIRNCDKDLEVRWVNHG